jgi:hypothetical protein
MIVQYRTLCTFRVVHGYYGGTCPCFELVVPEEAAREARRARLLFKQLTGTLHVLYEADESGAPRVSPASLRLRVGLRLIDPAFANVTEPGAAWAGGFVHFANSVTPAALDAGTPRTLAGVLLAHTPSRSQRPVTVRAVDQHGTTLDTQTVVPEYDRPSLSFDLHGAAAGRLTIEESYGGELHEASYYLHPELRAAGAFGVVEIDVAPSFYTTPPSFEISFQARRQRLHYYLVVDNYSEGDFNALRVADADETRAIAFTRVPVSSFTAAELPPALLASGATRLALFRSDEPVARQKLGLKKLQLSRNGDVLIPHLPQPGEGRPDANLIIHISK